MALLVALMTQNFKIVTLILNKLGRTEKIEVHPWTRGYNMLLGSDNVALFSTIRTEQREDLFQWIGPIAEERFSFYALRNSDIEITNIEDAKQYTIGVQRDDFTEQYLKTNGFNNITVSSTPDISLDMLLYGRIDLWLVGDSTSEGFCKEMGIPRNEIKKLYTVISTKVYIAFSKSTSASTISLWQKAYNKLYQSGIVKDIYSRYDLDSLFPGEE